MAKSTVIILIVFVLYVIIDIIYNLYKYKTNDGKITKDEVRSLISDLYDDISILINRLPSQDEKKYIRDQLISLLGNKLDKLSDNEKELLTNNMNAVINFILENKDTIFNNTQENKELLNSTELENK